MKIGIYTQPLRMNYGGLIQAWALQTILHRMGHTVVTFNPSPYSSLSWKRKPFTYAYRITRHLFDKTKPIFYEKKINEEYDIKSQYLRPFIANHLNVLEYRNVKELKESDFDVLIAGSDQVWRPMYNKTYKRTIENAYLDFARDWNVKRIAYAASFGTDEWEYNEEDTQECGRLLQIFKAISVREQSGIELCKKYLGRNDVKWVLDPTMLLDKEEYEQLIPQDVKAPGDLMCYVLDDNFTVSRLIKRIANEYNYKVFYANSRVKDVSLPIEQRIQPPVGQWLAGFRDAKLVITDSFHACVFSMLFHKPFIVIGNRERGYSRFESLVKLFGLESRLIENETQFKKSMLAPFSDDVYKKLEGYRKSSIEFLKNALDE